MAQPQAPAKQVASGEPARNSLVYAVAKRWVQALTFVATTMLGSTVGVLAGFAPPPAAAPAFDLVHHHPFGSVAVGVMLFLLTVGSWRIVKAAGPAPPQTQGPAGDRLSGSSPALLGITTAVATISTLSVVLLLTLVLTRPVWCPNALCPQPPGPHDQYLETGFTALQSASFVISGDPSEYSLQHLPASAGVGAVGAVRADASTATAQPYRLVVRVHSLQQGRFGMVIEAVGLVVVSAKPPPSPLLVWQKGAPLEYTANPFLALYQGNPAGRVVPAAYAGPLAEGHVQLSPGESDELAIQVRARSPIALRFQIRITYRIADQSQTRDFTMPYVFTVVFSDALDWQQYTLQDGRLLPG